MSADLFGHEPPPGPGFVDIRSTRPSSAETKAELALTLGRLMLKTPPAGRIATITQVDAYREAVKQAKKLAGSSRSSAHQLRCVIDDMRRWHDSPTTTPPAP